MGNIWEIYENHMAIRWTCVDIIWKFYILLGDVFDYIEDNYTGDHLSHYIEGHWIIMRKPTTLIGWELYWHFLRQGGTPKSSICV